MKLIRLSMTAMVLLVLSGCLYPEEAENQIPKEAQIEEVQNAVEQFQEDTDGLLPIKTVSDTREYFEYQIDFEQLVPNYLNEMPALAYEEGGHYQFIIIKAEQDPEVKIADLNVTEEIRSLNLRINGMGDHVQLSDEIGPNVYQLDLDHYNLNQNPTVESPYTDQSLNIYYNGGEEFVVDYRQDIGRIIDQQDLEFETGEDVRHVLYENTPVVPILSPEITVDENNDPIFMTNVHKSRN